MGSVSAQNGFNQYGLITPLIGRTPSRDPFADIGARLQLFNQTHPEQTLDELSRLTNQLRHIPADNPDRDYVEMEWSKWHGVKYMQDFSKSLNQMLPSKDPIAAEMKFKAIMLAEYDPESDTAGSIRADIHMLGREKPEYRDLSERVMLAATHQTYIKTADSLGVVAQKVKPNSTEKQIVEVRRNVASQIASGIGNLLSKPKAILQEGINLAADITARFKPQLDRLRSQLGTRNPA